LLDTRDPATKAGLMRQDEIWDTEAAQRYDTPGSGRFAPEVLDPAVERLAALAGDGPALEFAIGTGRVAIPLAARGVPVTGIELSRPMIDQLRTKANETTIPVIAADMATTTFTAHEQGVPAPAQRQRWTMNRCRRYGAGGCANGCCYLAKHDWRHEWDAYGRS
jgi:hypothetical protein